MLPAFVLTTPQALKRYSTTFDLLEEADIPHSPYLAVKVLRPLTGKLRKEEISHKISFAEIIKKAKAVGSENVLIFEDDVVIPEGFNNEKLSFLLSELPEEFGVCYLGCYFRKGSTGKLKTHSEQLLELQRKKGRPLFIMWGSHAVIINRSVYAKVIAFLEDPTIPVTDKMFSTKIVTDHPCFLLKPPLLFQRHSSGSEPISIHGNFPFEKMEEDTLSYISKNTV